MDNEVLTQLKIAVEILTETPGTTDADTIRDMKAAIATAEAAQ